jgi:cobalt-zinc-cadmium efflux system outer membrane protein
MWTIGGTAAWGEDSKVPSYTLQEIIDLTLTHNPIIELSKGIIDEKAGEEVTAQSYPNPTFGFQGGYGKVRDPTGPSLIERYFSLSQPLEWPGTRAARQQAAEAGVNSAQASLEETQVNVKAGVKRTFYELLLAETLADLASRLLNTVTELERAVKRRVESGEAPPFELVKVNVESLQAQKQVSQTKGKVRTSQAALNQLTAGNLGKAFAIQGDFESVKGNLNQHSLIEDAFHHHPEVRKFQQLIEVAGAQYNQEQHARVPNVTISGAYQRDAGRQGVLGGLSVPLPLWNQRQGGIAKALGIRRQAEANLRQAQISLRKGITEYVQVSKTASTQINTFEQGLLKQAKEAVRIARTSFTFGEASLLDVLDAQRVLWQTFQGYAYARFDLAIALTELERLVGKEL